MINVIQISQDLYQDVMGSCYTTSMKNLTYDKQGLGITEMTALGFSHPFLFGMVFWMIQHGLERIALKLTRMVI
jgi:hypothetical protein